CRPARPRARRRWRRSAQTLESGLVEDQRPLGGADVAAEPMRDPAGLAGGLAELLGVMPGDPRDRASVLALVVGQQRQIGAPLDQQTIEVAELPVELLDQRQRGRATISIGHVLADPPTELAKVRSELLGRQLGVGSILVTTPEPAQPEQRDRQPAPRQSAHRGSVGAVVGHSAKIAWVALRSCSWMTSRSWAISP